MAASGPATSGQPRQPAQRRLGDLQEGGQMGFFGAYLFDGTQWSPYDLNATPDVAEPWLAVDVYDSDITTVIYTPTDPGTGVAYLGDTPRSYFEDDEASKPTDTHRRSSRPGRPGGAICTTSAKTMPFKQRQPS